MHIFSFKNFVIKSEKNTKFGVQMDHHLFMISQVTAICTACNFQLYRLLSVRRYLTPLITSRLYYCNSLLLNLPTSQIARLQRIQNKAARLVTQTSMRELITLVLKELHWLPIDRRIVYKVLVITYKAFHGLAPVYLAELLAPWGFNNCLRGAITLTLHQPIAQKRVSEGAFGLKHPTFGMDYRRYSVHPVPYRSLKSCWRHICFDSVTVQRSDPHSGSGRYKRNFDK